MNILILDTETTAIEPNKCFCYNLGMVIHNTETNSTLEAKDFVITQVWDNLPLFESAYYKDKRPLYVSAMRARKARKEKWGYVCQEMKRDIKKYNVQSCYAYNSPFDDNVISFNCNWFHTQNPIETIPIFDIRGYAHKWLCDEEYFAYCEANSLFTESGNYSTTAEAVTRYIRQDNTFMEEHTALSDSIIETEILMECLRRGGELATEYPVVRSFPRLTRTPFTIKVNKEIIYQGEYVKKYIRNNTYSFTTPGD